MSLYHFFNNFKNVLKNDLSMKIMICSSMKFAEDIIKVKEKLELIGHQVSIPIDTEYIIQNPDLPDNLEKDCEHLRSSGIIKKCFNLIAGSDCVLVLNYKKNGIDGYIGTSVIMEIGIAHFLGKKIFLMNPIPDFNKHRWAHEIEAIEHKVINGDLNQIG